MGTKRGNKLHKRRYVFDGLQIKIAQKLHDILIFVLPKVLKIQAPVKFFQKKILREGA